MLVMEKSQEVQTRHKKCHQHEKDLVSLLSPTFAELTKLHR